MSLASLRSLLMKVVVIGVGTIGRDVIYWLATGLLLTTEIVALDTSTAALDTAEEYIRALFAKAVKRGKMTQEHADSCMARIVFTTQYEDVDGAGMVIEAATEDLSLKRRIMTEVAGIVGDRCLLCTTTSSLRWSDIFAGNSNLRRCFILHPFTPVWRTLSIEVVGSGDADTTQRFCELVRSLDKMPLMVQDRAGFAGNVLFCGLMHYACMLVQKGVATVGEIDLVLEQTALQKGPFWVHNYIAKLGGANPNEITLHAVREMASGIGDHFTPSTLMVDKAAKGTPWAIDEPSGMVHERFVKLQTLLHAIIFGLAVELIASRIISAADLNFLTQEALGYKSGVIDMMREFGDLAALFDLLEGLYEGEEVLVPDWKILLHERIAGAIFGG